MSVEWGLFNDEGMVEGGFHSYDEAYRGMIEDYDEEDELEIMEVCPDHPEEAKADCEECGSLDEDEEEGDEEEDWT